MRVRAQLLLAATLTLFGVFGLTVHVCGDPTLGPRGPLLVRLLWLVPVVAGVVWSQVLVLRYHAAIRRRLGARLPLLLEVSGCVGLVLLGVSAVAGVSAWSWSAGGVLVGLELLVLGGALGSTAPG